MVLGREGANKGPPRQVKVERALAGKEKRAHGGGSGSGGNLT